MPGLTNSPVQVTGSTPAGDDVTGTGNDATVELGATVNWVDFYNGDTATATVASGGETRSIPAESGRLLYFTTATSSIAVTCAGDWIATPMQ